MKTILRSCIAGLLGSVAVVTVGCSGSTNDAASDSESALAATKSLSFQNGVSPSAQYAGETDTTLLQNSPSTNDGSDTSVHADFDYPDGTGKNADGLLVFNVSAIPAGSTIRSVTLTLNVTNGTNTTGYHLYSLARSWSGSKATWTEATGTSNWETPGARGSADRSSESLALIAPTAKGKYAVSLDAAGIAAVAGWVSDPSSNKGFVIDTTSNTDGLAFDSAQATTAGNRPELTVTYTPATGTPPPDAGAPSDAGTKADAKQDGAVAVDAGKDSGQTPPPTGAPTIFGFNSGGEGSQLAQAYGRQPMARLYNGSAPLSASCFDAGNECYKGAMVGVAGVTSSKRINMSVIFDPRTVTSASSALAAQFKAFAAAVPAGWYVQLVMYHEWNLHTADGRGDGASPGKIADFLTAFPILAQAIVDGDAGRGRAIPVVNPAWDSGNIDVSVIPQASVMPLTTQLHMDVYDNPGGVPNGYKNYGTTYADASKFPAMYAAIGSLGYLTAGHGWGIDECNAPRRVAPDLSTLDTSLGWGPLSPHDIDGSGQAASVTAMAKWASTAAVPATTFLLFTGEGNWNQYFNTAGTANDDTTGANHQGWPINVDSTKPLDAYKTFVEASE